MFDSFFHISHNTTEVIMQWQWANKYPKLYTLIEIGKPGLAAIIIVVGGKVLSTLLFGRSKHK